jgi:hypothetical protein
MHEGTNAYRVLVEAADGLLGRHLMEDLDTKHIATVVIFLVCPMEVPSFSLSYQVI